MPGRPGKPLGPGTDPFLRHAAGGPVREQRTESREQREQKFGGRGMHVKADALASCSSVDHQQLTDRQSLLGAGKAPQQNRPGRVVE